MTKKKIATFGAAFVLVFTIGWLMGDSSAVNRIKRDISINLAQGNSSSPTTITPTKQAELKQVDYGQVVELGQFEFKVLGAENTKEAKTPTKSISTTTSTYEIVKLEVVNKRNAPADLQDFKFKLTDLDNKITYDINSDVSIDLSTTLKIMDKKPAVYLSDDMNPGLKNEFTAVFEVPSGGNYGLTTAYKNDGIMLKLK